MGTQRIKRKAPIKPNIIDNELAFGIRLMRDLVLPAFVLDPQCKVLIWNIACERLTGVKGSDVIGTSDHWRGFYDQPRPCLADLIAQDRASEVHNLYAHYEKVEENQKNLYAENWCVMPRMGTVRYLAINAGPIYDDSDNLIAVVETLRDMTIQKEAQSALERLATKDGLTGIANRRTFDEGLNTELRRAARESKPISLLMIDVDHFKNYNDHYGHLGGDECLKRIAEVLARSAQRPSDLVARYGGEEFAVILPNVGLDGARIIGQRICTSVEQLRIPSANANSNFVTVSIGAATTTMLLNVTPTELISAADTALYQAKQYGRNRVVATNVEDTYEI